MGFVQRDPAEFCGRTCLKLAEKVLEIEAIGILLKGLFKVCITPTSILVSLLFRVCFFTG